MRMIDRRTMLAGGAALGAMTSARPLFAQPAPPFPDDEIDSLAASFMKTFEVPGVAIAIIRAGAPDLARGYGVRTLGKPGKVDAHTLFGIASNSKAFTAAALALLVDEKKIGWDDPVIRYLPEFRMYDPAVTRMMTVRDLLIHGSGLALGAGDLMQFPETTHSLADMLHGLQYLKPERGFRTGYAYDNILYIVAGILITRLTGQNWEDFVTARLLVPLGMTESVAALSRVKTPNVAGRHARLGPPMRGMGPVRVVAPDEQDKIDAAGGINASAHDILAWLHCQLAKGKRPDGTALWSEAQSAEMWTPRTITASGPGEAPDAPTRSVMAGYALGWFVQSYRGQRLIHHSGGLTGQVTQQALLPEKGIAVAVYTNSEDGILSIGLRNALLDRLLGAPAYDWLAASVTRRDTRQAEALKEIGGGPPKAPAGAPSLPLAAYVGRYRDPWYGDIVVALKGGALSIDFTRTPAFKSRLEPWGTDAFRTRFPEGKGEDAVVTFAVSGGAVTGVTMKALSPLADFSYDFQHLAFAPVR